MTTCNAGTITFLRWPQVISTSVNNHTHPVIVYHPSGLDLQQRLQLVGISQSISLNPGSRQGLQHIPHPPYQPKHLASRLPLSGPPTASERARVERVARFRGALRAVRARVCQEDPGRLRGQVRQRRHGLERLPGRLRLRLRHGRLGVTGDRGVGVSGER